MAGVLKNGQTLIDNQYEDIDFDSENKIFVLQQMQNREYTIQMEA